jgi:hypothetical protein
LPGSGKKFPPFAAACAWPAEKFSAAPYARESLYEGKTRRPAKLKNLFGLP